MSNIRYLESMVDHFWPEMHNRFPALDKPQIIPAATLKGLAPTYMRRYIDQDPNSFYMFIAANPLSGDSSRQMACEFFDDFFYNKMQMPSSYDRESGMSPTRENPDFGTMEREDAISKEVLPAQDDQDYESFYEEQMAKAEQQDEEAKAKKKQEKIDKLGFDPEDEDIIDIDVTTGEVKNVGPVKSKAVTEVPKYAVGLPKKIWYGVDFHISAGGGQLGYGGGGRLHGRGRQQFLRNSEDVMEDMMEEALLKGSEEKTEKEDVNEALIGRTAGRISKCILEAIRLAGTDGVGLALRDVYEKFFGELPSDLSECDKTVTEKDYCDNDDCLTDAEEEFNESIMKKFRDYFN